MSYTPTPTHLHPPAEPTKIDIPITVGTDQRYQFFYKHPPQKWLPEFYLEYGEANLDPFFEILKDPAGKRHKALLESEQTALLEKKIFHVDVDGDVYRQATEDGVRRRKRFDNEDELGDETTLYNKSPLLTWNSEGSRTPPPRAPKSPTFHSQHLESSPGSPTVRQVPLTNVFDASTEEVVVEEKSAALASLNQTSIWTVGDVDLLSKFTDFKRQPQSRFSLALDGIADFSDQVSRNLNEREGFGDLTWPFIRGALTLVGIRSRCFEIPVAGTKERKNYGRDLSAETEEQASMADGVGLFEDHQIYIAEASLIHEPKQDKEFKDKFKVVRCMRDSWNCQIRSIARESVPPQDFSVFGSTSFEDETKFYAMDFIGTYRLREVGRMLVPLRKSHFATRMETCVKTCLKFALDLEEETIRRTHLVPTDQDLRAACDMIEQTRTTPTKEVKRRRVSGVFH
ncbi:hypothetical protein EC957_007306 [Mortierella hygrophila]|uniref:Uncharacterized protein n=1 Tax=Mortierella hygrophila TaxID=979708 RepID=A0A9P6FDN5_9FUNG|nr:hypothetical protein EC957_007306 [Mortierella hygrophila]